MSRIYEQVPPGLTSVDIIDFSLARFVNFESEISFPEEGGILQVVRQRSPETSKRALNRKSALKPTKEVVLTRAWRRRTLGCTSMWMAQCCRA